VWRDTVFSKSSGATSSHASSADGVVKKEAYAIDKEGSSGNEAFFC
jgi:hypothetical protein